MDADERLRICNVQLVDEHETEFDRIAIDNLLDTLAEVASAIARRRERLD